MRILIGTYSQTIAGLEARGEGIYGVSFDAETGAFGTPGLLAECGNSSALALNPDGSILFASREVFTDENPALLSFRVSDNCELSKISQLDLAGQLPCQLTFEPVNGRLASAQYWTGDVAVCDVVNGEIQPSPVYLNRTGTGPNPVRQEGPHAHCTVFSEGGTILHATDLGTDCVVSHRLDDQGNCIETQTLNLHPGSGPRHMVLNHDASRAFVLCELDESLVTLQRSGIGWKISNAQPGFAPPRGEDGSAAAIRLSPDQQHLYISGRRQSRIAVFAATDTVTPLAEIDSGGLTPRDFMISADGNWLIVANQDSDALISLRRDNQTGGLSATGHTCNVGSPVALVEMPN